MTNGVFTPEQDNDKTNVEPMHSYDAFHTRFVGPTLKTPLGLLYSGLYRPYVIARVIAKTIKLNNQDGFLC